MGISPLTRIYFAGEPSRVEESRASPSRERHEDAAKRTSVWR